MHKVKPSGQLVIPGDNLGVIEEFISGPGTYVRDGFIFAKVVGRSLFDLVSKKVSVYSLARDINVPQVGNIVTGNVMSVQDFIAILRIFKIGMESHSGFFNGMMHVSDVSLDYVDSMFDVCRLGDILRAEVISDKNGTYHLSTKDKDLGVLYAFCSRCGSILRQQQNRTEMMCDNCRNIEKRKTAPDYGKAAI